MKKAQKVGALTAVAGAAVGAGAFVFLRRKKAQLDREAEQLITLLGLHPGSRVADVGAGDGSLADRIAEAVGPNGYVQAVEIEARKLRKLRQKESARKNLAVQESLEFDCQLPAQSCDAIYMRGSYHHITHPESMNASLLRSLRPGGTLAVIDFAPRWYLAPWTPKGIPENRGGHGIRQALVVRELTEAGFEVVRMVEPWSKGLYCILFQKPISA